MHGCSNLMDAIERLPLELVQDIYSHAGLLTRFMHARQPLPLTRGQLSSVLAECFQRDRTDVAESILAPSLDSASSAATARNIMQELRRRSSSSTGDIDDIMMPLMALPKACPIDLTWEVLFVRSDAMHCIVASALASARLGSPFAESNLQALEAASYLQRSRRAQSSNPAGAEPLIAAASTAPGRRSLAAALDEADAVEDMHRHIRFEMSPDTEPFMHALLDLIVDSLLPACRHAVRTEDMAQTRLISESSDGSGNDSDAASSGLTDVDSEFAGKLLGSAAGLGRTDLMARLAASAGRFSRDAFDAAGRNGRLDTIRFMCESDGPCDVRTVSIQGAVDGGSVTVLQFIQDWLEGGALSGPYNSRQGYPSLPSALPPAHLDKVAELATATSTKRTIPGRLSISTALASGQLQGVWWVLQDPATWSHEAFRDLASQSACQGHEALLEFALDKRIGRAPTREALDLAAANGHRRTIELVGARTGVRCTSKAIYHAASGGHMDLLRWLIHELLGPASAGHDAADPRVQAQQPAYREHLIAGASAAARRGHSEVFEYLCAEFPWVAERRLQLAQDVCAAARSGHLRIVEGFVRLCMAAARRQLLAGDEPDAVDWVGDIAAAALAGGHPVIVRLIVTTQAR
ncbi:hypothetical protein HK105_206538 [Polyrhizophydium stewartii]|uniref:Ankyrin repeat protein n=1 Tax=Polyrhizophydium stewartii TaxID=2732419 RepID=A0ABR4N324_9FUNG